MGGRARRRDSVVVVVGARRHMCVGGGRAGVREHDRPARGCVGKWVKEHAGVDGWLAGRSGASTRRRQHQRQRQRRRHRSHTEHDHQRRRRARVSPSGANTVATR